MVGLSLLTFVSEHLEACIGEIDCDRVKTGIEGLGGNKGGLAVPGRQQKRRKRRKRAWLSVRGW